MRPTDNLGNLFNHIAFVLGRQSDQILQERLGIGFSQFKIMMVLRGSPHVQQKEIAESLGQTEAGISRQIKLLQAQGLLQSIRRPEDRREHITSLTIKGERFTDEAMDILNLYHAPAFESLSARQQHAFLEALHSIHQRTCESSKLGACHHAFGA